MTDAADLDIGGKLTGPRLIHWAAALVKDPRSFFAGMSKGGGYASPMLYVLFWSFIASLLSAVATLVKVKSLAGAAAGLFLGPVFSLLFGFVAAGVLFVIWHLMGSKENYQTSYRCWAMMAPLSAAGAALGLLPFLNALVSLYGFYLVVLASIETHKLPSERSWAVWGSIAVVLFISVGLLLALGLALQGQNIPGLQLPPK